MSKLITETINNNYEYFYELSKSGYVDIIQEEDFFMSSMTKKSMDILGGSQQKVSYKTKFLNSVITNKPIYEKLIYLVNQSHIKESGFLVWSKLNPTFNKSDFTIKSKNAGCYIVGDMNIFSKEKHYNIPEGISIQHVMNINQLKEWSQVIATCYKMTSKELDLIFNIYLKIIENNSFENPFKHYIAYHNKRPVAVSSVFYGSNMARLYNRASVDKSIVTTPRIATYFLPIIEFNDALKEGYSMVASQTHPNLLKSCAHLGFTSIDDYFLCEY